MSSDVDSEKLLDWIGLSKKLKMTNEDIVNNLQVMLINIKFETDSRIQKISEGIQTTAETFPEQTVYLLPETPAQPETPQVTTAETPQVTTAETPQVTTAETPQVTTEQHSLVLCRTYNLQF